MSIQETDRASAAVAVAPRVALSDIEGAIAGKIFATGAEAFGASPHEPLGILTLCARRGRIEALGDSNPPHMAEAIGKAIQAANA